MVPSTKPALYVALVVHSSGIEDRIKFSLVLFHHFYNCLWQWKQLLNLLLYNMCTSHVSSMSHARVM